MGSTRNAIWRTAIVLGMTGALALPGCAIPGKLGQMSKFDATRASKEEIAKALKEDGRVAISAGILFETDSASLTPSSEDVVKRIAAVMKENPDLKLAVVGNTDDTGDFRYNLQLSERRAKAFADALVKSGISSNRLAAVGVGPLMPVASNDSAEGRAQNRRVELVLIR